MRCADTAFEFVTRLDGTLAPSHWQNASAVSSVADAQRHPGGVASGTVIRVAPQQWAVHGAGAGGWSYGVTGRRVMSAWVKSSADGKFAVLVSTSVGDRELRYYFGGPSSGAPAYVSSTEAHFRSTLALDGCWHRLERNLAADVAAAWSGATLTGVRGMAFHAYHASSAMWVDDVRFSNAMTLERNSLLPGAVGQIVCRRATDATNFGHADTFYFYDHIGNVQGVSSSGGSVAETYTQDAWGNVLASATTGQWATTFGGRHLTTKEYDGDVGMYYFWQRWYSSYYSLFVIRSPFDPTDEYPHVYCENNPVSYMDPLGLYTTADCDCIYNNCVSGCKQIKRSARGYKAKARRAICYAQCASAYSICLAGAEETLYAIGAVAIIAGVTYIIVQTGGGALILVPVLI
jgi:RHS repeat-associated protein